ncbi:MAG: nucleotidyltransferase [Verrucomicrobiota bacterium]|nr:nucleotidyltransferase [Verrucomicrobiota bacterium]
MNLSADLREFIELLNSRGVEYVIVGAHSLAFHGRPRYTGDLDILIRPCEENATKIVALLRDFGFGSTDFAESDFTEPGQIIQLGRVPHRIDLLTSISGVATDEALRTKIATELEGLSIFILSKDLLIQNKRAVARPQDLADLKALAESDEL